MQENTKKYLRASKESRKLAKTSSESGGHGDIQHSQKDECLEKHLQRQINPAAGWNFFSFAYEERLVMIAAHVHEQHIYHLAGLLHDKVLNNEGFYLCSQRGCRVIFMNPKTKYLAGLLVIALGYPQLKPLIDILMK